MSAETMRHVDHRPGGGPECLRMAEGPVPEPGPHDVLVRVAYAGINRPDVFQRSGSYPPPADASPLLGLEISGEIVALGADVSGWKVGDQVCALTPGGGYAEYCVAPAEHCLPVPAGLSMLEAAALPETYFTVWSNVFERGALQPGEAFLVHGGSSGIGLTAIQLAKQFGATVYTTVGSSEKADACRRAGADRVINYHEEDFVEVLRQATDGNGVNVILDMVGGDYIPRNIKSLAVEGRLVQIAFLKGSRVELDTAPIMRKRLTFTGSTLRPRSREEKADIAKALQDKVWPLLDQGLCHPVIHATFPLGEAAEAHRLMESSKHIGKIMLEVGQ
ncbi:NAD(P)H-quinone oxidoreductase [Pseudomonas sp. Choline-3u-10]|jgi:NADPH:quinone reductase|uniref:NAD(P)H-quinone oxidoreductase n=1 Tax=Pseudomonadaceae TaxID=135621 RepID=UPI000617EA9D|nr:MULTISPECIES: NAD(P)H-quinone oxidoreductase [Pseudomonadaceae]MBU0950641.1 NAD(P)H-quinone oxidoreductase [Gammaproteobacteria bacterium]HBM08591.1 NAD(P)H-quinone oxidoreductase [Pseudomonas sp.]KJJ62455.1 NAD(P)H-quinone oxidoreductase [Pseudomonas sp. 10B238]MBK3794275.1 zinc-binding dehydrogenase [Stutzerimonas stutzeri]MBK3875765.1 zinc-binding dehydrogenase [Stutzerimonas stutzeri]|tara:strand:+ start:263 stop:1261 length:999 start_codon:yes stop_codon:yes gene_type:complete